EAVRHDIHTSAWLNIRLLRAGERDAQICGKRFSRSVLRRHARSPGAAQSKQRPPGVPGRRIPGIVVGRIAAIAPPSALISMGEEGDLARVPLYTDQLQDIQVVTRIVELSRFA